LGKNEKITPTLNFWYGKFSAGPELSKSPKKELVEIDIFNTIGGSLVRKSVNKERFFPVENGL